MTKSATLLTALAVLSLSTAAYAADVSTNVKTDLKVKSDASGSNYDKTTKTEQNDSADTTTKTNDEVKVKTDAEGNVKKTVETTTTTDPKGLMNKSTAKSTTTTEENADGTTSYKHKKKVDGKVVEENNQTSK
jgi:hypothetical protein